VARYVPSATRRIRVRLEVKDHERQVLLEDLDETLDGISEIYSRFNEGRAWNRYDPRNDHGLEILVHARDDLAVDAAPWTLEARKETSSY
jgi:hypothetical protein